MSREEIVKKFKDLIKEKGMNGILDVTKAGTAVVSIEFEESCNDIIFVFDEENDDFCLLGDYTTEELCDMYVRFAVNC